MTFDNDNFDNLDKNLASEETKKYGNQNKNLIITILFIIFIAITVAILFLHKKVTGITADYAVFYPDTTMVYIDAQLDSKKIEEINKNTGLNIKDLPNLLERALSKGCKDTFYQKNNALASEALGDNFSFGVWKSHIGNNVVERSLFISPIKREKKAKLLFKQMFGKNKKLISRVYDGYQIITTTDQKRAYLIQRNKLFLADSYDTLTFVIDNYFLKNSNSLFSKKSVQKSLTYLEKNRIGTVILSNFDTGANKLASILGERYKNKLIDFNKILKSFDSSVISVLTDNDFLYLNSYTNYDFSKAGEKSLNKAFQAIFDTKHNSINLEFLPQNTLGYLYLKGFKNYINFILEFSGIKQGPEYEQAKQFTKMLTTLDLDNDILKALEKDAIVATIDCNSDKPKYVMILDTSENTDFVVSKLLKLISVQLPTAEIIKASYKNFELGQISSPKYQYVLCYGKLNQNLYVIGEKIAVEALIDTIKKPETSLSNTDLFKDLKLHSIDESQFSAYLNIKNLDKMPNQPCMITKNIYLDKIKNHTDAILLNMSSKKNILKSSLQISLKK